MIDPEDLAKLISLGRYDGLDAVATVDAVRAIVRIHHPEAKTAVALGRDILDVFVDGIAVVWTPHRSIYPIAHRLALLQGVRAVIMVTRNPRPQTSAIHGRPLYVVGI